MPSYSLDVNLKTYTVDVDADTPLLWILRDTLDLTGTKFGCGVNSCGACTVLLDGKRYAVANCKYRMSGRQRSPPLKA